MFAIAHATLDTNYEDADPPLGNVGLEQCKSKSKQICRNIPKLKIVLLSPMRRAV